MLKEFITSQNFMVLTIVVGIVIVLSNGITACTPTEKEIDNEFKLEQAKMAERKEMIAKGYSPAYLECVRVSLRSRLEGWRSRLEGCKDLKDK